MSFSGDTRRVGGCTRKPPKTNKKLHFLFLASCSEGDGYKRRNKSHAGRAPSPEDQKYK